jgi:hypothetical protein
MSKPRPPKDKGPNIHEAIKEAETRSLDFPAAERAAYVRSMVKKVQELKTAGRNSDDIEAELPEFKRDHPHLFEMVAGSEPYDTSMLEEMLAMLDKMGDGKVNHHKASVAIGQRLSQMYLPKKPEEMD